MRDTDLLPDNSPEILCPECGEILSGRDDIYTFESGDTVVGCSLCLHPHNAKEWYTDWEEAAKRLSQNYRDDSFTWS